ENPVPTKTNPLGAKGAGEAGCVGALPAVMLAIMNALEPLGVKELDMPATSERGWQAIQRNPPRVREFHGATKMASKKKPPGLTMVQKSKRAIYSLLLLTTALLGLSRASWGQGDADLEAPGLEPFPTPLARGATLFQNVGIFDGKSSALSAPSNVLIRSN